MGYGTQKRKVVEAIDSWGCVGFFGYGQGRAVAQFGEDVLGGKSICLEVCPHRRGCRLAHIKKMDAQYPLLANLVHGTIKLSRMRGKDPSDSVISVLGEAVDSSVPDAVKVKEKLKKYRVDAMTDHYRCGQFENIDDGISKRSPGARCE